MAIIDSNSIDFEHLFVNSSPDYGPQHGQARLRPIGDPSPPTVTDNASFQERRDRLRSLGDTKNQLIDDLLVQLKETEKKLAHLEKTVEVDTTAKLKASQLEHQLKEIKATFDRDPYVAILLDGNHITFTEPLLREGEAGGKDAAEKLHEAFKTFAMERLSLQELPRFKLCMYADFESLVDKIIKSEVIKEVATFERFVKGFNGTKHLFDLIDVGSSQEILQQKLRDQVQTNLYNCHCRHILFGGFEGDLYLEALRAFTQSYGIVTRLTLIDTIPQADDTPVWNRMYSTVKMEDIFCAVKPSIVSTDFSTSVISRTTSSAIAAPVLARIESSSTASHRTPPASAASTPHLTWAGLAAQPVVTSAIPPPKKVVSSVSMPKLPPPASKKPLATGIIEYNRHGQRVDKQDSTIPYHEITRVKKMKLCNTYYLQDPTACISDCNHQHEYPITNFERRVLREVARMMPCYYKMECEDPDCIYGHRCPQSKPNVEGCYFGHDCRFWGWGHGIDTTVVKTTRI